MDQRSQRIGVLIREQAALLEAVAVDPASAQDRRAEYLGRHAELAEALRAVGNMSCFCPWNNAHAWPAIVAATGPAWREWLDKRLAAFSSFLDEAPPVPAWTLEVTTAFDDFLGSVSPQQQAIVDAALTGQLRVFGTDLLDNEEVLEWIDCPGGRGAGKVLEFKVKRKGRGEKIQIRIFVQTQPGNTLVLLWGFDKGADDREATQRAAIAKACGLRRP